MGCPLRMMFRSFGLASILRLASTTGVLALAASAAGCTPAFIPNTDVEDNNENRKVVAFCEQYRHAVEEKNIGLLMKLAHPRYHEDGGNANGDDDLDYEGLRDYLANTFVKTDNIRYEIRYRKVIYTEAQHIHVDYTYAASYKIPGVTHDEWKHAVADNRLDLVPDGETYKIMAGM